LHELAAMLAQPAFFSISESGINCGSGFIRFATDGTPSLIAHAPDHRCRHTLPGRWSRDAACMPPKGSLLARLLGGEFRGNDDANPKVALLAEVIGAASLGYATKL
jgi:putative DNA primase/helicase